MTNTAEGIKGAAYIGTGKVLHPVIKTISHGLLFQCGCHSNRSISSRIRFIANAIPNCKK